MKLKILILGGASGDVGRDLTRILLRDKKCIEKITVTSRDLNYAKQFVTELDDPRVSATLVNVTNRKQLLDAMNEHNLIVNTVGPFSKYGILVMNATIESKVNYIDICDDIEPTVEALQLNQFAEDAGIFLLLSRGWFPGMSNLRTMALSRELDEIEEIIADRLDKTVKKFDNFDDDDDDDDEEDIEEEIEEKIEKLEKIKETKVPTFEDFLNESNDELLLLTIPSSALDMMSKE